MLDPALIPYVQRLDRDPEDADALANVWRILDAKGDHQTLAKLAEKVAARQRTPAVAVALLHRTAELWSREIGRDDQAIALWQRVLSVDPDHEDAALALASAYARTGRIDLASPLHARLLERTRDPEKRVALLEQIAALKREAGDIEGEVQALRDILKVGAPVANTINHRRALAKILVQRGRAASGTNESETHPDIIEAARILGSIAREGGLGRGTDFATAALALWPGEENAFQVLQAALSLRHAELIALRIRFLAANPTSPIVSQVRADLADSYLAAGRVDDAISVLATAAHEDASAGQQLARLYERTGRHRDLAALLASTPLPKDPVARVVLLRRRAAAHRAAGDRPALLAALRDVLNEAPADLEALPEVERDLRMRGALDEVRERLRAAGAVATAPVAMRVKWLREVALLSERHFNDAAGAIEAWETIARVSEEVADIEEAHASLDRLLGRAGRWEDLLARFEARAGQALDAPTRRAWWTRWLEVHREHRRDPAQEATVLTQLLADDPNDDQVALALIDARRRAGDNAGVESLLRALIARATPSTVGMRWSQLAGHLEQNKDTRGALEAWRQARTLDPSQAMAWSAEERILEAAGDFEALVDVLVAHASHPTAAGRRAGDLYARAADLSQRFGLDAQAAQLAERALRFMPEDPSMLALLQKLAEERMEFDEDAGDPTGEHAIPTTPPMAVAEETSLSLEDTQSGLVPDELKAPTAPPEEPPPEGRLSSEEVTVRRVIPMDEKAAAALREAHDEPDTQENTALTPERARAELEAERARATTADIEEPAPAPAPALATNDTSDDDEIVVEMDLSGLEAPPEESAPPAISVPPERSQDFDENTPPTNPVFEVPLPVDSQRSTLRGIASPEPPPQAIVPAAPPTVQAREEPPPPPERVSVPPPPPSPPETPARVSVPPPEAPAAPASAPKPELPSIIVEDSILVDPSLLAEAPEAPPSRAPPPRKSRISGASPPARPLPPLALQPPPAALPLPPLTPVAQPAPAPPPLAPLTPIAQPAPVLPPLTPVAQPAPMPPPSPAMQPLTPIAQPAPVLPPLNYAPPPSAPVPLQPLAPVPIPLQPLQPLAPTAAFMPVSGDPFATSAPAPTPAAAPMAAPIAAHFVSSPVPGDPFAAAPTPGDPFAPSPPALTAAPQAPAPMQMPPINVPQRRYERVMGALFEQATQSLRAPRS